MLNYDRNDIINYSVDNVPMARMSWECFANAMDKVRPFTRLADIGLDSYNFSTIFVYPPRAVLDDHTIAIIKRFEQSIYVSCNTSTLVDNLESLCQTHDITALAAFDKFPYTEHLETEEVWKKKISILVYL